jgi:hypothetical protein
MGNFIRRWRKMNRLFKLGIIVKIKEINWIKILSLTFVNNLPESAHSLEKLLQTFLYLLQIFHNGAYMLSLKTS